MTRNLRYTAGRSTGAILRQGRDVRGRELRYIPGGPGESPFGNCPTSIYRRPFVASQLPIELGAEDTEWTIAPGFAWLDGTDLTSIETFGQAYTMRGLRMVCDDRLFPTWWNSRHATSRELMTTTDFLNFQPHEGEAQWWSDTTDHPASPYQTLAAMPGGPVLQSPHLTSESLTEIHVPSPFAIRDIRNIAGQSQGAWMFQADPSAGYEYYITHVRAVINDQPAGPVTAVGHPVNKTVNSQAGNPYQITVHGAHIPSLKHTVGGRLAPLTLTAPCDAGTKLQPGDVIGYDVWLRIVRENDTHAVTPIESATPEAFVAGTTAGHDRGRWPHVIWAEPHHDGDSHSNYDNQHGYVSTYWSQFGMPIRPALEMAHVTVNSGKQIIPERDTFELEFVSGAGWTPDGQSTFRLEQTDNWDASHLPCRVYVSDPNGIPAAPGTEIGLTWQGDTALLMFRFSPSTANATAVSANTDPCVEIGYYPEASIDPNWDAAYLSPEWAINTKVDHLKPGPFDPTDTTFRLAYVKMRPGWGLNIQSNNPGGPSGDAMSLVDISETIRVRKVRR